MNAPDVRREGDDFIFDWAEPEVRARVERIREAHDELRAEVTVYALAASEDAPIYWGGINLKAPRTRAETANALERKFPIGTWLTMLEQLATLTQMQYRGGSATVDLARTEFTGQVNYLVDVLLPEGETTVIFGDGGTGKSLFSQLVALCSTTGKNVTPVLRSVRQARWMLLDWETQDTTAARRWHRLAAGMELQSVPPLQYRRMARPLVDDMAFLRSELDRLRIEAVIWDSLGFACGGDPKDAAVALQTMNMIHSLGRTNLVLAHITKADAASVDGAATIFGSQFFRNAARSTWEMRASENFPPGEHGVTLFHRKTNEEALHPTPIGLRYVYQPGGGPITVSEYEAIKDASVARFQSLRARILDALPYGCTRTAEAIAEDIGAPPASVHAKLRQMKGADVMAVGGDLGRGQKRAWGRLVKVNKGEWEKVNGHLYEPGTEKVKGERPLKETVHSPFPLERNDEKGEHPLNRSPALKEYGADEGKPPETEYEPFSSPEERTTAAAAPRRSVAFPNPDALARLPYADDDDDMVPF